MNKATKHSWLHLLILAAIGIAFWLPAARHIGNWGDDMWHRAFTLAGAARRTILTYRQFPFWNPYLSGGAPLLANPASSFLSPTFLAVLAAGEVIGLKLRILIGLLIGLWGGYFLGRKLAPGRFAPLVCAAVFMLGSWYPLYMSRWHDEFIPFIYLPWLLLFFLKGREQLRWCVPAGLVMALIYLEGGVYPAPYAALFIATWALLEALKRRALKPLGACVLIFGIAFLVSAPKLLPSIELHLRYPRATFWPEPTLSWEAIPRMLWGRDQLSETNFKGAVLGWWEYGMYVGALPLILAIGGALFLRRRSWHITLTGLFFGCLMFGDYGPLSAWHWVHKLPAFSSLHDPSRFRIPLVLCLALLSSMAFSRAEEQRRGTRLSRILLLLTALIVTDFYLVNAGLYGRISSKPPHVPERRGPFRQRTLSRDAQQGPESYLCFLRNEGLINNYEPLGLPAVDVRAFDDPGYRGEAWIEGEEGGVTIQEWSPNRLTVNVTANREGRVVINQRYDPGWRAAGERPVFSHRGLIATNVTASDKSLTLLYVPRLFVAGCILAVAGLFLCVLVWRVNYSHYLHEKYHWRRNG